MKNIFLTSSLQKVAKDLTKHLDKKVKKFLFITTASEFEKGDKIWLKLDHDSMTDLGYELEDFTVTQKSRSDVEKKLKEVDGVVMAGGNTIYLLQQMQLSNSIELFRKFVKDGKIYIGSSAGSLVAGPNVYAVRENKELKDAPRIKGFDGLNITDLILQPHWGSSSFKKIYLNEVIKRSYIPDYKMVLASDSQYIIVENNNFQFIDINDK